jgi:hypothetical protein
MELDRFQQLASGRAPDVNADVSGVAHRCYLASPVKSAHLPELDTDGVHGAGLDVTQSVRCRFDPFVSHDRHGYVLPHERHTANIVAAHGLLHQAEAYVFELPQHAHGLHGRISLIGIRRKKNFFPHRVAYSPNGFHIPFLVKTDLDFDVTVAAVD